MGIGDWGLGIGDWAKSPILNPQSPLFLIIIIKLYIYLNYYLLNVNNNIT